MKKEIAQISCLEKIKAYLYLFKLDRRLFFKYFQKFPFAIIYNLFFTKNKFSIKNDYTLFNLENIAELENIISNTNYKLFLAFSYCQKPLSCKKERFSNYCCSECDKCIISNHLNLKNSELFTVTTTIDLGHKLFHILNNNKNNNIFVFTACPYAISLYSMIAKIFKIKAIALKLDGPVCGNFQSFIHAEQGKKKKVTTLSPFNEAILKKILQLRKK